MRSGLPSTLLLVLTVAVLVGASLPAAGAPAMASLATQTDDPPREGATLELRLQPDGDAEWRVSIRFDLAGNDTVGFDRLATEFEDGSLQPAYFEAFERARSATSDYTGREMEFRNVTRTAEVVTDPETGERTGVLRLSFVWTEFAQAQGSTVRVDDSFQTGPNSTWFPAITEDETFVVRPPPGYGVDTAPTGSRDGVLRWEGPETFEPGYLEIRYRELAEVSDTPGSGTDTGGPLDGDDSTLWLVGALVGLGILAVGVFVLSRRGTDDDGDGTPVVTGVESNGGTDDGGAAAAAGAAGGATAAGPDEDDGPDMDLLSDEERVEYLLERSGGRMKQANIVKETGWSNAKVSQLLSAMDEEGRVDKLRIGRENLISLPDEDVTGFEE